MAYSDAARTSSIGAWLRGRPGPPRGLSLAVFGALTLCAAPAWPAKWDITTGVSVEETWSDNINLSPPGTERSDTVTTLTPKLSVRATGDRLQLDAEYNPQLLYWQREGSSHVQHNYSAGGTVEIIKREFGVDFRSTESQQVVSLLGPQPASNVNLTDNRTAVRTNLVSPFLHKQFGPTAQADVRYTFSTVNSDSSDSLSNSRASRIDAKVASGSAYKLFTWNVGYSKEHVDYSDPLVPKFDFQTVSAEVTRLISRQLALVAKAGYEDADYLTLGPATKGALWNAGFDWNPSPQTHLLATAGRRYFGPTKSFDFSHRTRLTVWNIKYSEDVSTTRSNFLIPATVDTAGYINTLFTAAYPDPAARQAAVNAFLSRNSLASSFDSPVNFFTNNPFLIKSLQASVGIQGIRNTVLVNLFRESREVLGSVPVGLGDFAISEETRQTGGSLSWTHAVSPITTSILSVGIAREEFVDSGREDKRKFVRASLTRQFQPRIFGSLTYRRLQNSSSDGGADYRENAVTALITARF